MNLKNLSVLLVLSIIIFACVNDEDEIYQYKEKDIKPEIETSDVSQISYNKAVCGGNLVSYGSKPIVAKGIVWHTSSNASITNNTGISKGENELGKYVSNMIDLESNTEYFVRSYVSTDIAVVYGKEQIFTTKDASIIEMIKVSAGSFEMGSKEGDPDEKPVHTVQLDEFYIGKYELMQAQWEDVMPSNPSAPLGGNLPVTNVDWDDVQSFISKLNKKTGLKYRLPTEAEWEYAARGASEAKSTLYSGSNIIDEVAWIFPNSGNNPQPVGTKKANELGIYDMSGNVWEWCSDWYSDSYYNDSPSSNPQGPSSGFGRIVRGGSWGDYKYGCRVANRYNYKPDIKYRYISFRLVLDSE